MLSKFLILMLLSVPALAGECDITPVADGKYVVPVYCTKQKVKEIIKADGSKYYKPIRNTLVHDNNDCEIKDYLAFCSASGITAPSEGISDALLAPELEVRCGSGPCKVAQVSGKLFTVINGFEPGFGQGSRVYDSEGKLLGVVRKKLFSGVGYVQRIVN